MDQLSLLELNNLIKRCIEENLSGSYWIVAEISELRVHQRGHCYLELVEKDGDEILAKMKATIWSYAYRNLSGWFEGITGETLKPGLKILANVQVNFHQVFGISLNIRDIDPKYTIGERARRRQEILRKLQQDGTADMNRELPLPLVPQRIAVIASPTSAGYQDFMEQLGKNPFNYHFKVELYQALMQGKDAEKSIIRAMLAVNESLNEFDVLVIIRGGGANLDLDCFDSYDLASHVAQFPLPVITGIGHERDETITDLVANTKLKTPTAVAEFLIGGCRQFDEKIEELFAYIADQAKRVVKEEIHMLEDTGRKIRFLCRARYDKSFFQMNRLSERLKYTTRNRIQEMTSRIGKSQFSLHISIQNILSRQKTRMDHIEAKLTLLDPGTILNRGFSITRLNNRIIKDADRLHPEDIIETEFSTGKIRSKII
ncbi:MAG: exodeoxyribonuclease VII large subunit [Cyclobacteriaceae bacterium]|nr:exodeoxyribonuclease VII large subunit [Cyclobacteriaceae bacterium]